MYTLVLAAASAAGWACGDPVPAFPRADDEVPGLGGLRDALPSAWQFGERCHLEGFWAAVSGKDTNE